MACIFVTNQQAALPYIDMHNLVSVVMPAYDVATFVEEAVSTLHGQTYPAIELIAVNDGSRDRTGEILNLLAKQWTGDGRRMIVVNQDNAGAAAARNAGLAVARGDFVCMLDADDRLTPSVIERLLVLLRDEPEALLAAPLWRYIDQAGRPTGEVSDPSGVRHDAAGLVVSGPLHSATAVMVRAEAARKAGRFDTELRSYIDLDWFVRTITGNGAAAAIVPEPLADYRRRPGQITSDWRRMKANWERVLEKMAESGHGLSPDQERRARARNQIYWATLAYQSGDYANARLLVAQSWRGDARYALGNRLARIRTLAALASLFPTRLHRALRRSAGSGA